MAQKDIGNKVPLHTLKKVEDVAAYYDEWALNNKYDKDMEAWNYTGPVSYTHLTLPTMIGV